MKRKIKILLIMSIILLIALLLLVLYINNNSKKEIFIEKPQFVEKKELQIVQNRSEYYTILSYINSYINCLNSKDENTIINILDKQYKTDNNITEKNLFDKIKTFSTLKGFTVENMYYEVVNNIGIYYVNGKTSNIRDIDGNIAEELEEEQFNIIVIVDYNNNSYSIIPCDENKIEGKQINTTPIVQNEYNKISFVQVTDEQMAQRYYNDIKIKLMNNKTEEIYNLLDDEIKNNKFVNMEELEKYLEIIKTDMNEVVLQKWGKNVYEEYTQYTCLDSLGRYYIFNETSPMQYTLFLGKYSVDLPDFIETYNSANPQEKVVLNIEKIKQALNAKDYTYVYNKLANSFKENNYKTQGELEQFINNTLFEYTEFEYDNFVNEGEIYIYDIVAKNHENEEERVNMQIIMRLKEDRDFEIAFSIK